MNFYLTLRNYFAFAAGQLVNMLTPFIIAPIIISVCGLNAWGQIGVATSVLNIICLLIDYGSQIQGVKYISLHNNDKNKIVEYISVVFQYKFLAVLLLLLVYFPMIYFLPLEGKSLYYWSSFFLIFQMLNPLWILQGLEKFKSINKIILISKLTYIVLVILLIKEKSDYKYCILLLSISNIIVYSISLYQLRKIYNFTFFRVDFYKVNKYIFSEFPIFINTLSNSFLTNGPLILVNYLLGNTIAGIFKLIEMVITVFRSYLSVYFNVTFPRFCNLYSKNKLDAQKFLKKINILHTLFLCIGIIILKVLSIFYLQFIHVDDKILEFIHIISYLLFLPILMSLNIPFYQLALLFNYNKRIAYLSISCIFLLVVTMSLLANYFGLKGAVMSIYITEFWLMIGMVFIALYKNEKYGNE